MLKAYRLSSRITIDALILRFSIPPLIRSRWTICIYFVVLLTLIVASKPAWAEDNYYQIINGSVDSVSDEYEKDRGYTIYFKFEGKQFLLDTGFYQSSFFGNLKTAGINTDELDFVILSHSHIDHTSGWKHLRKERPQLTIYVPPGQTFSYSEKLTQVEDFLQVRVAPLRMPWCWDRFLVHIMFTRWLKPMVCLSFSILIMRLENYCPGWTVCSRQARPIS